MPFDLGHGEAGTNGALNRCTEEGKKKRGPRRPEEGDHMALQLKEFPDAVEFSGLADPNLFYRVRAEYLEMPALRLSVEQAMRLWALDRPTCNSVLKQLVKEGFLERDTSGLYMKAHTDH